MQKLVSSVSVLSESELEAIHTASLGVLERTGFKAPHPHCLDACAQLGAAIEPGSSVVRVPGRIMEDVLDEVRKTAEQDPAPEVAKELQGWISTQINIVDYRTSTRRPGTLQDVKKGIALVETLRNIGAANAVVVPSDVPSLLTDVISFQLIYTFSSKPGGTFVLTPFSARQILAMAGVMNRSASFLLNTVSPLQFQADSLEIARMFAEAGHRVTIAPMVMAGGTGPVTIAGALTLANAEALASLFVVFALARQAPRYTAIPHSLDMRTALCSFGSPNQALFGVAVAQMARRYGLIPEANVGLTDSLQPDFQAGFEKAVSVVFAAAAGIRAIGAQGLVGADQGFSFEQLVIDNEWLETYNYVVRGFSANAEAIADEVIDAVGIGGTFLTEEHTARHARSSQLISKLFVRQDWDGWLRNGRRDLVDRAAAIVEAATRDYENMPPACTASQRASLEDIASEARLAAGQAAVAGVI